MVDLPHTWNSVDGQDGGNDYWRGTCTYERELDMPEFQKGEERVYLEFCGCLLYTSPLQEASSGCPDSTHMHRNGKLYF